MTGVINVNVRRLFDREPIWELEQHFRAARLTRVHAARYPVDRLGCADQLLRLFFCRLSRVGQRCEHALVLVDLLDRRLVGNREQHHVAAFFCFADLPHRDPIRSFVERLVVPLNVLRVREFARRARHAIEEFERRGNRVGGRQVIDQLGADPGILRVLLYFRGVLLILFLLRRLARLCFENPAGNQSRAQSGRGYQHEQQSKREARERAPQRGVIHTSSLMTRFMRPRHVGL